jgi:hypothetical protein
MKTKQWTTGGILALDARNKELEKFVSAVARCTKDGECRKHLVCDGARIDCDLFDMPSDDAVYTLHTLINEARELIIPKRRKAA